MHREHHRWFSPSLARDMELLVFGHAGARVIVFPTSCGRFFDWENRGLVSETLGEHVERGRVQLYCVDSVDAESWYANHRPMSERVRRHAHYDDYIAREVLPFSARKNANSLVIVTGASFGGYHAVNFGLRHPEQVNRILSMSGLCDIKRFTNGYYDETIYFHNPVDFIANESDPRRLDLLKKQDIILAVGRDDSLCASNELLSRVLWSRGIGNALRVWGGFAHDWPVWDRMLRLYLGGHD